jgi:hypothetical protein
MTLPPDRSPGFDPGFYVMPCRKESKSNLFVDLKPDELGQMTLEVWTQGEQCSAPEGFVECQVGGSYPWPTHVCGSLSVTDRTVLAQQREILTRFWQDLAAQLGLAQTELSFSDFELPSRTNQCLFPGARALTAPGTPLTWSSPLGTEDHEGGTLPVGTLLDLRQELIDVPGLFACGPATFPRMGAANPSLTTLALSRRLANVLSA